MSSFSINVFSSVQLELFLYAGFGFIATLTDWLVKALNQFMSCISWLCPHTKENQLLYNCVYLNLKDLAQLCNTPEGPRGRQSMQK